MGIKTEYRYGRVVRERLPTVPKTAARDPPGTIVWKSAHCAPSSKLVPGGQVSSLTGTSFTAYGWDGLFRCEIYANLDSDFFMECQTVTISLLVTEALKRGLCRGGGFPLKELGRPFSIDSSPLAYTNPL